LNAKPRHSRPCGHCRPDPRGTCAGKRDFRGRCDLFAPTVRQRKRWSVRRTAVEHLAEGGPRYRVAPEARRRVGSAASIKQRWRWTAGSLRR
jgi:hypothetical protein